MYYSHSPNSRGDPAVQPHKRQRPEPASVSGLGPSPHSKQVGGMRQPPLSMSAPSPYHAPRGPPHIPPAMGGVHTPGFDQNYGPGMPGSDEIGNIRVAIQMEVGRHVDMGVIDHDAIDGRTIDFLATFPPSVAMKAVTEFFSKDLSRINNKSQYIKGIARKVAEHISAPSYGGISAPSYS